MENHDEEKDQEEVTPECPFCIPGDQVDPPIEDDSRKDTHGKTSRPGGSIPVFDHVTGKVHY